MNAKNQSSREKLLLDSRIRAIAKIFSAECSSSSRILDMGCGDGKITMLLKACASAQEAYGLDVNAESVKRAREAGVESFNLDLDKDAFPFERDYFDAMLAGEVLEHLIDPDHLLDEAHRTLKGGGILIITTRNLSAWYNRVALLLGFQPFWTDVSTRFPSTGKMVTMGGVDGKHQHDYHLRVFTYRALNEFLELHNFEIKNRLALASYLRNPLFNAIEKLASFVNASSGMLFVAVNR